MRGIVRSGCGAHSRIILRDKDALQKAAGFTPYEGTLNVSLREAITLPDPITVTTIVYLYPVLFNGTQAYIIHRGKPRENDRAGLAEIISPLCLRDKFNLKDGDIVTVEVVKK